MYYKPENKKISVQNFPVSFEFSVITYGNCQGVAGYMGSETLGVVCTSDDSEADASDRKKGSIA